METRIKKNTNLSKNNIPYLKKNVRPLYKKREGSDCPRGFYTGPNYLMNIALSLKKVFKTISENLKTNRKDVSTDG